ncbi:MAG TPA: sigma-70 family RNA polymerase sigma factor [Gemmatimonadales bacterium]|nr:sigma-70 family RNA polymerase sigma factor [Gemmatimonadales bacterium]
MESPDVLSSALEALLARFARMVRSVGGRRGLSDAELDELMQSVRLRIWRARGTSEQITLTPTSYVYRTAVSAALDLVRARRTREDPLDAMTGPSEHLVAPEGGAEANLELSELTEAVWRAVEGITPSRRPVLRMYLAGYEWDDIATFLGWSPAKTRNLLYRGLADLRAALTARGIGPGARP